MTVNTQSRRCPICSGMFTSESRSIDDRCQNPAHWQAAGMLASTDYYQMARITAGAEIKFSRSEPRSRPANRSAVHRLKQPPAKESASHQPVHPAESAGHHEKRLRFNDLFPIRPKRLTALLAAQFSDPIRYSAIFIVALSRFLRQG